MATSLWDLGYKFIVKACSEPHHVDFFLSLGPQNRGLPFPTRWWPLSSVNVFVNLREVEWVLSCSIPHSSIHQAKLLDDLCDHKLVAIPNWGTTLQRKRRAKRRPGPRLRTKFQAQVGTDVSERGEELTWKRWGDGGCPWHPLMGCVYKMGHIS